MTDEKQIEIKRGTGVMADLLNKEMDSLIKSYKCGDCVHLPLCMAQKGGVNLGLASENDCMYYQPKLPEDAVIIEQEDYDNLVERAEYAEREIARLINVQIELQELNIEYYNDAKDLRRELKQARKETAEEILDNIKFLVEERNGADIEDLSIDGTILEEVLDEIAKQYGVEEG